MAGSGPAWARNTGCTVDCEYYGVTGATFIALFFLYGLLVLNTKRRISVQKTVVYCCITLAVAELAYLGATYGLGLSAWPAALTKGVVAVLVFIGLFNPRRHPAAQEPGDDP